MQSLYYHHNSRRDIIKITSKSPTKKKKILNVLTLFAACFIKIIDIIYNDIITAVYNKLSLLRDK